MEDLTRFGLVLVGFPVAIFGAGLVIALIGRGVTRRAPDERSSSTEAVHPSGHRA